MSVKAENLSQRRSRYESVGGGKSQVKPPRKKESMDMGENSSAIKNVCMEKGISESKSLSSRKLSIRCKQAVFYFFY